MKKAKAWIASSLVSLPRKTKRVVAVCFDATLCAFAVWFAYYLRLGEFIALSGDASLPVVVSIFLAIPIFLLMGLYREIFRFAGWSVQLAVARATLIYGLFYAAIFTAVGIVGVPRTVGIIQPILMLLFVGITRALVNYLLDVERQNISKKTHLNKVLIYGAGAAGRELLAALSNSDEMKVIGFLDDDNRLHGQLLNRKPIYPPSQLVNLVQRLGISDVLLALPSIDRIRRNRILSALESSRVAVRSMPSLADLARGRVTVSDLRELGLDDLLGRDPVHPNNSLLSQNTSGKVVLVTGAGGSIGSELCRQILDVSPARLLLVDHSEYALYTIHQELREKAKNISNESIVIPLLGNVQSDARMREIMTTWNPNTVYHAAAYKHVPLVEYNLAEGIHNNLFGTLTMALAAEQSGVSDFVLISTDKAVRPTNVMGASKRLAELVLQALSDRNSKTKFSMVRFGNVLGSSGSVVPKFRKQIHSGGPVTVTHQDVTRYFMTTPEASQLVIQAGAMARGGDVFFLDMGEPVRVMDLARRMIELTGLTVRDENNLNGDIDIEVTGLRPGEKLFEELLIGSKPRDTAHERIKRATEEFLPWEELEPILNAIEMDLRSNNLLGVVSKIENLVEGYSAGNEVVDWIYKGQHMNRLRN